jgi:hypothetical protein
MNSENKVHVPTTTTKQQQHNSSGNTQHFQHNVVLFLLLFSALVVPQGAETRDVETSISGKQVHQKKTPPPPPATTTSHLLIISRYWCMIEAFAFHFWYYNLLLFC